MSKPESRMFQVISSRVSAASTALKLSSSTPFGSAVTRLAAQPSPQSRNERICSRSVVSLRCTVQSSRLTMRTRAEASERTMWRASFSALIAA